MFANIVIGDEINRASPKTQSALLECMQESQATVDGATYPLPRPFLVIATQNPVEMEGTYPLPEAQRDRFMARLSVGYPDRGAELEMLERQEASDPLADLQPVTDAAHVARAHRHRPPALRRPGGQGLRPRPRRRDPRPTPGLRLGASPRASIQLLRAAKALAALAGRDHVLPDDVQDVAEPVLAHRLLASTESRLSGRSTVDVVQGIVARTAVPPVEAPALAPRHRLSRPRAVLDRVRSLWSRRSTALARRAPHGMWTMRPTPRGWGLLTGGSLFALSGVGWGSTDITRLGLLGPLVVGRRRRLGPARRPHPGPARAAGAADASARTRSRPARRPPRTSRSSRPTRRARARLSEVELGEQAASQLSGGLTLRARVERAPGRITADVRRWTRSAADGGRSARWSPAAPTRSAWSAPGRRSARPPRSPSGPRSCR